MDNISYTYESNDCTLLCTIYGEADETYNLTCDMKLYYLRLHTNNIQIPIHIIINGLSSVEDFSLGCLLYQMQLGGIHQSLS